MKRYVLEGRRPAPTPDLLLLSGYKLSWIQLLVYLLVARHKKGLLAKELGQLLGLSIVKTRALIRLLQRQGLLTFNGFRVRARRPVLRWWDAISNELDHITDLLQLTP